VNSGISIQLKSFSYNTKLIRKILIGWAKTQIVIKGKTVWNENKKLFLKKKNFEKVILIMDSSDFQLFGKASTS
jgi:hypothetical protein